MEIDFTAQKLKKTDFLSALHQQFPELQGKAALGQDQNGRWILKILEGISRESLWRFIEEFLAVWNKQDIEIKTMAGAGVEEQPQAPAVGLTEPAPVTAPQKTKSTEDSMSEQPQPQKKDGKIRNGFMQAADTIMEILGDLQQEAESAKEQIANMIAEVKEVLTSVVSEAKQQLANFETIIQDRFQAQDGKIDKNVNALARQKEQLQVTTNDLSVTLGRVVALEKKLNDYADSALSILKDAAKKE